MATDIVLINKSIEQLKEANKSLGNDDPIRLIVPFAYLILVNRGSITNPDQEVVNYCKQQTSLDRYNALRKDINAAISCLDDENLKTLIWSALSDSFDSGFRGISDNSGASISRLVYKLLRIEDGDIFYDFGSGLGEMIISVFEEFKHYKKQEEAEKHGLEYPTWPVAMVVHLSAYGKERNHDLAMLSRAILEILIGSQDAYKWAIEGGDGLHREVYRAFRYTKGYVYIGDDSRRVYNMERHNRNVLYPDCRVFGQWKYVDTLLSDLNPEKDSRAVALLFNRALSQVQDNEYVQRLIRDGWIEGIIELPPVLAGTNVTPYLVIFSKNNETIKMLDATNTDEFLLDTSPKTRTKTNLNVEKVVDLYDEPDLMYCNIITNEQALQFNTLVPSRVPYFALNGERDNYVSLDSVADVFVGSQYTMSAFDISKEPTGYKILTSSDIDNGLINWERLISINMNKTLYDKYKVQKGDLVLTTKSSKVKTAVVDIEPTETVIVTGGMIIVRPHEGELDPTYLKMFLDSSEGREVLNSCQTGSSIVSISLSDFKKIGIPKLEYSKQVRKASKYNEILTTIGAYYDQINTLEDELKYIISEDDE